MYPEMTPPDDGSVDLVAFDPDSVEVGDVQCRPVWDDAFGAKSSCWAVETPSLSVCIDPGVAAMQPSYPLPDVVKEYYVRRADVAVRAALSEADLATISHYHRDHYLDDPGAYDGTELWVKDPNRWINDSQWNRAREFVGALADRRGESLARCEPRQTDFADPLESLDRARSKDFGEYQARREELLAKWRERFRKRVERWRTADWLAEPEFLRYADGERLERGETVVRFVGPLFHGIEYANTGWVFSVVVQTPDAKVIHSSDLQGPVIEDYADWLAEEDPDLLFLDGPATYLLGYILNRTNLQRSIDNAARVLREVDPELMVWGHHLLRDPRFRERTREVWQLREEGYNVETAAALAGEEPLVEQIPT